ncbi:MAG TPA: S41 family peptidase [Pyrinomonadaceae bacterium]|nr:S41 family peptidase [Pyrinomonadaceae bacterium]
MSRFRAPSALALALIFAVAALAQQGPPEQPDGAVDAAVRKETIETLLKRLNDAYVFPETAAKMEQDVRARLARGEYDRITSARQFAEALTNHLREVSRDKHLGVRYSHQPIPVRGERKEPSPEELEEMRGNLKRINYGFERLERLPGNIGYMDLRGFTPAEFGKETVAAAFNFLANTDALIVDLRKNGGGSPEMVQLICSYLFDTTPVHLNSLYWREGNRTQEFWTLKDVSGKRYGNKEVYVLTSKNTFSGAEEFSYNLKNLKRATIVGETTGGGAHPGGGNRLSEHFAAFIPTGRAINPITKTNWEGTGVEPDVKVPADQALHVAQLSLLRKTSEATKDEMLKGAINRRIALLQKELGDLHANTQVKAQAKN